MEIIKAGDLVGFTFFIGYMAMLAASLFFFFERQRVSDKWKASLLVSGIITFIAAVHYYYMRGVWLELGESPTEFRYIDWTLTVPLMCVEFYLILRAAGAKVGMLIRLILASILMLVAGYIGEAFAGTGPDKGMHLILWGTISTVGWAFIIYEIFFGEAKTVAEKTNNPKVQAGFNVMRLFVFIGWAIYPIGYMMADGNLLSGLVEPQTLDLVYNIGDAINKIGFGLVIYAMAIEDDGRLQAIKAA